MSTIPPDSSSENSGSIQPDLDHEPGNENENSSSDLKIEITEVHEITAETLEVSEANPIEDAQIIPEVPLTERTGLPESQTKQEKKTSFDIPVIVETISMMNAKVGESYNQQIPIPEGFFISGYGNVDDPGLHIDTVLKVITGKPTVAGNVEIELSLKSDHGGVKKQKISFAVIPDPKSLWKDIPSKVDGPFWKMPLHSDVVVSDLHMVAASRRGRSHAHEGTNRDDDFALMSLGKGNWQIAAVADGAGSSKFSRRASQIVVNHSLLQLPSLLAENVDDLLEVVSGDVNKWDASTHKKFHDAMYKSLAGAAFASVKRLEEEFKASESKQRDFYTTLLIVVAKKKDDGWIIGSFSIGDGGIGIYSKDREEVIRMSHADGGTFAGETYFLTKDEMSKPETYKRVKYKFVRDFTAIVAMTDGITDPFFPADNDLEDAARWHKFWDSINAECNLNLENKDVDEELLKWMDFYMQGQNDDRTLAILRPVTKG